MIRVSNPDVCQRYRRVIDDSPGEGEFNAVQESEAGGVELTAAQDSVVLVGI